MYPSSLVSDSGSTFDWESERASSSASMSLDYSGRDLEHLPDELFDVDLEMVTELDLSHNNFVSLPTEIFQMQNLARLDLRDNKLTKLPEAFCKLQNLRVLILSGNRFESFPQELLYLTELVELQIGANRLQNVPDEISTLTNLEVLYLGDNRLTEVPSSLGSLPHLTALALAQNRLELLPESFSGLYSLRTLTLHNNKLRALPTGIARLQNLEQLNIRNNPLITQFVNEINLEEVPTLKELTARVVKLRLSNHTYMLPPQLQNYLKTANQCVNPKCKGVYFESCNEHIKFVDFCGRFRVPLLQFLCSSKCTSNSPAHAVSSLSGDESDSEQLPSTSQEQRMRKVLLG